MSTLNTLRSRTWTKNKHAMFLEGRVSFQVRIYVKTGRPSFENIITSIHFDNQKDNQKLKHSGKLK